MPDEADKLYDALKRVRAQHHAAMRRQSVRATRERTLAIQALARAEREIHEKLLALNRAKQAAAGKDKT